MAKNYNNVTPISDTILNDYDTRMEKLQSAISCSNEQIAELKYLLHRKTCQLTETKKFHDEIRRNIDKYSDALYDVKYAIACALEVYLSTFNYLNYKYVYYVNFHSTAD